MEADEPPFAAAVNPQHICYALLKGGSEPGDNRGERKDGEAGNTKQPLDLLLRSRHVCRKPGSWERCPGRFTSHERPGHIFFEVAVGSALEAIVKHDGRLDVLCCLRDGEGKIGIPQVAAQINEPEKTVRYWMRLLELFGLAQKAGEAADPEPPYVATLSGQPDWVEEAIEAHRSG